MYEQHLLTLPFSIKIGSVPDLSCHLPGSNNSFLMSDASAVVTFYLAFGCSALLFSFTLWLVTSGMQCRISQFCNAVSNILVVNLLENDVDEIVRSNWLPTEACHNGNSQNVSMLLTTVLLMYIYTACWLNNYVVQLCPFWCNSYDARLSRLLIQK